MANVASYLEAKVSPDGSRIGFEGISGAEHLASCRNCLFALPDHAADGTAEHVVAELGEEGLLHKITVVIVEEILSRHANLHPGELVPLGFEAGDDVADDPALDSVRLDLRGGGIGCAHRREMVSCQATSLNGAARSRDNQCPLFTHRPIGPSAYRPHLP